MLAKAKAPVTGDLRADLAEAMHSVITEGSIDPARIARVMLGTHRRTWRLAQRGLKRVGVLRIGSPLTHALPPLSAWPIELRTRVSAGEAIVRGGADYDGRPAAALDEDEIARFLAAVAGDAESIAITSVFSPVAPDQEFAAADLVRRELGPSTHISLSHEIGTIGLLERENATVLNGAFVGAVEGLADALDDALVSNGIGAETFVTQNDGTLMTLQHGLRFPVLLIGSGPASALRGAAYLSGVGDGVVIDVGGTRANVGVLESGLPRESARPGQIEGVRLAFRMPDVITLPLASGSLAPDSVADAVDRAKGDLQAPALVVVGGADRLVPEGIPGVSDVIRPPDGDVAAAIGAAMAPVSSQAECICSNHPAKRQVALAEAEASACARAVSAGADPARVAVIRVDEVPLAYLADPAIRIRVHSAGPPG
jgi:N-methylhydantoinase A/oxoprolinase/acetone carboxylase beta subunit